MRSSRFVLHELSPRGFNIRRRPVMYSGDGYCCRRCHCWSASAVLTTVTVVNRNSCGRTMRNDSKRIGTTVADHPFRTRAAADASCFAAYASMIQSQQRYFSFSSRSFDPTTIIHNNNINNINNGNLTLESIKQKARKILSVQTALSQQQQQQQQGGRTNDNRISNNLSLWGEARRVLDYFKTVKATDAESVNLSIALMEHLVAMFKGQDANEQIHNHWVCDPRYYGPLLNLWREAAKQNRNSVISPLLLLRKLQAMSRAVPEFRYNIVSVGMILDVVIKQTPHEKAPFVAEDLLRLIRNEATQTRDEELRPNAIICNTVMQAWALSGLPQAPNRMFELLQWMQNKEGIAPTEVTYNILLRYWANRGTVDILESILQTMKDEGVIPSRTSLSSAIHCCSISGRIDKAEEYLQQMTLLRARDKREIHMLAESTLAILFAYRRVLGSELHREKAVADARSLFDNMVKTRYLNDDEERRITATMMDIYVHAGKYDEVEMMTQPLQLNSVQLSILIKALGQADRADKASAVLKRFLQVSRMNPDCQIFNELINAWSESSKPDAVDQAFLVLKLMTEEPKCIERGIKPDTITFNALIKCLAKSNSIDAGKRSIKILDEMERRYQAGNNNTKPDDITFMLIIKACFQADDTEAVEALLDRLQKSDTGPNIRTFCEILTHYAKVGTPEAAVRAEAVLKYMQVLAQTKKPALRPGAYAYNIVINAWLNSGHSNAHEHIWRLYEQMKEADVEPDFTTVTTLITSFSKFPEQKLLERADYLLKCMEESKHTASQPNHRQYLPIIKGWLTIGNVDKATKVLMRHIDQYFFSKGSGVAPNAALIDMIVQGWIEAGKLDRATSLIVKLQNFKDQNLIPEGPNSETYNSLSVALEKSMHPNKSAN